MLGLLGFFGILTIKYCVKLGEIKMLILSRNTLIFCCRKYGQCFGLCRWMDADYSKKLFINEIRINLELKYKNINYRCFSRLKWGFSHFEFFNNG